MVMSVTLGNNFIVRICQNKLRRSMIIQTSHCLLTLRTGDKRSSRTLGKCSTNYANFTDGRAQRGIFFTAIVEPRYYFPSKCNFLVITVKMCGPVKTPIEIMYFFPRYVPANYAFPSFYVTYLRSPEGKSPASLCS